MMIMKIALVLVGFVILTEASQDVIMEMSKTFAKPMEACRKEVRCKISHWCHYYNLTHVRFYIPILCKNNLNLIHLQFFKFLIDFFFRSVSTHFNLTESSIRNSFSVWLRIPHNEIVSTICLYEPLIAKVIKVMPQWCTYHVFICEWSIHFNWEVRLVSNHFSVSKSLPHQLELWKLYSLLFLDRSPRIRHYGLH